MNDQTHILAAILALTDAVFLPCRSWTKPLPQNVYQARREYERGGCPWRPSACGDAQRKNMERTLSSMADRGAVLVHRRSGLRWPLVKLSDQADWTTRSLCSLPGKEGAFLVGNELLRQSDATTVWIPERALMGATPDKYEILAVENMALGLLVRGYAISGSDILGNVFYALTDAGITYLKDCKKPKPDGDKSDSTAVGVYDNAIKDALHHLATEKILDSRELGLLPLPVAHDFKINSSTTRHCVAKDTGNGSRKTTCR